MAQHQEAQRSAQELHDAISTHSAEMAKAMSLLLDDSNPEAFLTGLRDICGSMATLVEKLEPAL